MGEASADPSLSDYRRPAGPWVDTARVRRAISLQAGRFLPAYVEASQINEALAINYNTYVTVMSDANTPRLVQMMVGALARWYDEHDEDEAGEPPA